MVLLAAAGMVASARTITVQTQPVSPYLDTEVSTNVVLHGNRTDTRKLDMRIRETGKPRQHGAFVMVVGQGFKNRYD